MGIDLNRFLFKDSCCDLGNSASIDPSATKGRRLCQMAWDAIGETFPVEKMDFFLSGKWMCFPVTQFFFICLTSGL